MPLLFFLSELFVLMSFLGSVATGFSVASVSFLGSAATSLTSALGASAIVSTGLTSLTSALGVTTSSLGASTLGSTLALTSY